MQILNLTDSGNTGIEWTKSRFPDGEVIIKLGEVNRKDSVKVICRITNAEDLFILMQVGDILNRMDVEWTIRILYLMSMRMDRVMNFQVPFSLKVVAEAINSLHAKSVEIGHPHSERSISLINNSFASGLHPNYDEFKSYQLCYPDAGSMERYKDTYESPYKVLVGEKVRNTVTGKIESIVIENKGDYAGVPVMVVDDLCDAGGTFLGIASAIREIDSNARLSISIYHMVNEKGIQNLTGVYENITFTDSYRNWCDVPERCTVKRLIC